jgi:hypothetical protein
LFDKESGIEVQPNQLFKYQNFYDRINFKGGSLVKLDSGSVELFEFGRDGLKEVICFWGGTHGIL